MLTFMERFEYVRQPQAAYYYVFDSHNIILHMLTMGHRFKFTSHIFHILLIFSPFFLLFLAETEYGLFIPMVCC